MKRLSVRVAIRLAAWLLQVLFWTLRPVYIQEPVLRHLLDRQLPFIAAFWHGRLLYPLRLMQIYRQSRVTVLVSRSRDGEWISRIAQRFGVLPTRGSSHRGGGQGLLEMVRRVQEGYIACVTPDGPRGPRYQVQPGVVTLAQKTGAAIVPITYNAKWRKVMRSWDGFVLPLPFSRVVVIYGEPVCVPAQVTADRFRAAQQELEQRLQHMTDLADRFF
ncbi:lysophospholipid acyltransferase family protein [Candidatus Entotheonella palauensis]|uniref:DUF374 domain-containing protein n=1 Tax=Candidatus Entotheonella gemina TaxID=1429439 RepID=W4MEC8_9BACT|nr:lysophospholipid acyltransferase family protein [Candidatus Entotheonella palauensis]ETX08694.1 MAG: hypothetical protein ETSY2_03900 [Candidatus Entotheonella gemina]